MRIKYLDAAYGQRRYEETLHAVESFEPRSQSSWYFHASDLVRLASTAYVIGRPFAESRAWFRRATAAYGQLFALRGTKVTKTVRYRQGKPLPEESIVEDGYTSIQSMSAAYVALVIRDVPLAQSLVELAGHSPAARLVSPTSQVCTTNEQTLSHALNALVAGKLELAEHEARKLSVRKATKVDRLHATAISALALGDDFVAARDEMLKHHARLAMQDLNPASSSFWLSLPALGLSALAMEMGQYQPADLKSESVHCPVGMLTELSPGSGAE